MPDLDLVTPDAVVRGLAANDDFLPPPALWAALHSMRRAVGPELAPRLALGTALSMMKLTSASVQGLLGWLEQVTGADAQDVSVERICTEPVFAFRSGAEVTFPRGLDALLAGMTDTQEKGRTK